MKICWDNLEGVYLTKNGNFKEGIRLKSMNFRV